jgi:hypothetical protein
MRAAAPAARVEPIRHRRRVTTESHPRDSGGPCPRFNHLSRWERLHHRPRVRCSPLGDGVISARRIPETDKLAAAGRTLQEPGELVASPPGPDGAREPRSGGSCPRSCRGRRGPGRPGRGMRPRPPGLRGRWRPPRHRAGLFSRRIGGPPSRVPGSRRLSEGHCQSSESSSTRSGLRQRGHPTNVGGRSDGTTVTTRPSSGRMGRSTPLEVRGHARCVSIVWDPNRRRRDA